MNKYQVRAVCAFAASLFVFSPHASAVGVSDYMVITESEGGIGHSFVMSDSEVGAIGINGTTSAPGSLPTLPGGTARTVSSGITLDGDVAVTNGGDVMIEIEPTITSSNSDVHALNTGVVGIPDANAGSQGIDCSSSFAICTDNGSQISSNNRFNTSSPDESFSTLAENNGVQGNVDLSGVTNELAFLRDLIPDGPDGLASTGTIDLASGLIENANGDPNPNAVWDFSGDSFTGLNVIDITTNGNDFYIVNSNLTIKGDAGDKFIFRIDPTQVMNVSQSNLLIDGIDDNSVLWYVDADEGEESFNFNNVTFQGMALWDIDDGDTENVIQFNNVQFCGQVITDVVNFQNVSGSECAFEMSAVPVPALRPAISLFMPRGTHTVEKLHFWHLYGVCQQIGYLRVRITISIYFSITLFPELNNRRAGCDS
jgi:hypothetical protein